MASAAYGTTGATTAAGAAATGLLLLLSLAALAPKSSIPGPVAENSLLESLIWAIFAFLI